MPDYRYFRLEVEGDDPPSVIEAFRELEEAREAIDPQGEETTAVAWYEYENYLREFSKNFPDVKFSLFVAGEQAEHLWVVYAKDGLTVQKDAIITYPSFEESMKE